MRLWKLGILATAILLVGCSHVSVQDPDYSASSSGKKGKSKSNISTAAALGIPPGHLPPPGKCRIWLPGTPPGHQPKPASCNQLAGQVPPGAWLVYRPTSDKKHVKVTVYGENDPNVVISVRLYDIVSGLLVAELDS